MVGEHWLPKMIKDLLFFFAKLRISFSNFLCVAVIVVKPVEAFLLPTKIFAKTGLDNLYV
jgi:hypothetical protein